MTRILVPPGIGDVYWVLVKLESIIQKRKLDKPEITIVSYPDRLHSHLRSIPFLEMVPWIRIGNPPSVPNNPGLQQIWDEAYLGPGRSVFPDVMEYDYFVSYNGCINSGGWLETTDEYECNWLPPIQSSIIHSVQGHKRFMICFFPFLGTYQSHERDFPIPLIAESINRFVAKSKLIPIFIGGKLEQALDARRHELLALVSPKIDLVGQTSLKDIFGLLQGSQMVFGYHSGIPNIGAAIGKPSIFLWDNRFPESTSYACVPPWVRKTTYHAVSTKGLTVDSIVEKMESIIK